MDEYKKGKSDNITMITC